MGTPDADIDDWGLVVAGSEEEGVTVGLAGDELPLEAPVGEGSVGAGLVDEGLVGLGGEGFVRVTGDRGAGSARGSELEQPTVPSSVAEANAAIICRMTAPTILCVFFSRHVAPDAALSVRATETWIRQARRGRQPPCRPQRRRGRHLPRLARVRLRAHRGVGARAHRGQLVGVDKAMPVRVLRSSDAVGHKQHGHPNTCQLLCELLDAPGPRG